MSSFLPAPVHQYETFRDEKAKKLVDKRINQVKREIPRYPLRNKHKFIPRSAQDFGDGGAYPEIHLAQFPLNMGKKGGSSGGSGSNNNTLALQVRGEDGKVSYDAIVTQQHRNKTKVYTKFSDMVEKDNVKSMVLPTKDEEIETANRTKDALQALVQGKIKAAHPVNVTRQKTAKETSTYIRYTPHSQGQMGGQSQQRIIRMVDVAKDPMEPPKFQHKKAVRGPPSPPVPVLHSPPRKLTVQDQQNWKIPPCISNWKNSKGFTIALDKRLAADGRGLQQVTINDNFASLAESLAIAERKAREEVNMRAQVQKKLAMKEKEQKENELRDMAAKARMERAGIRPDEEDDEGDKRSRSNSSERYNRNNRNRSHSRSRSRSRSYSHSRISSRERSEKEGKRRQERSRSEEAEEKERKERDRIRHERKKEREREMRMEKLGKKGKLLRDQDRDVSEKIALGQLQGTGKLSGDALFDSRLFNQSQGMDSGFGQEDEYNVYSKPLLDRGKASVYRPKADAAGYMDADKEYDDLKSGTTKRFKADKQFRGTEAADRGRDGPVQFSYDQAEPEDEEEEKQEHKRPRANSRPISRSVSRSRSRSRSRDRREHQRHHRRSRSSSSSSSRDRSQDRKRSRRDNYERDSSPPSRKAPPPAQNDDDPFGLDQFLTEARKGKQAMDDIGRHNRQGVMNASAGGHSSVAEGGSGRERLQFQRGSQR